MKSMMVHIAFILMAGNTLAETTQQNLYSFKAKDAQGQETSLSKFKNKVVLVVNVASNCGYTSQYDGLEKLYKDYQKKGFVILGFPSNEFGGQEPGTDAEIQKFCKLNRGVTFPVMAKTTVNGPDANLLYKWLTADSRFKGPITWNFNKFLINKKGEITSRFDSSVTPKEIEKDIKSLLK